MEGKVRGKEWRKRWGQNEEERGVKVDEPSLMQGVERGKKWKRKTLKKKFVESNGKSERKQKQKVNKHRIE